jgi:WD40 repeat protein
MDSSITALRFISDEIFVSGSRGGCLQVWNVDSEKDLIGINGAHSGEIVDIKLGSFEQKKKGSIPRAVFSSASEDGKVLSWNVTLAKNEKAKPLCFDVVNHSIDSRYLSNREARTVSGIECIDIPNTSSCDVRKVMFSTTSNGDIHLLRVKLLPDVESQDALLLHRERIEEEAITLHSIAPDLMNSVEIKDRKKHMLKYKLCFVGR